MDKMYRVPKPVVVKNHPKFRRFNLGEITLPLKLEIELNDTPTASQISSAFKDIERFLSRVIGGVMAAGDGQVTDPKCGLALQGASLVRQSADHFAGSSGIVMPTGPQPMPTRQQ